MTQARADRAARGRRESELGAEDAERLADPSVRDEVSRAVIDAVLLLNGARPSGG